MRASSQQQMSILQDKHLEKAYIQSEFDYRSNPVLHGNAALSDVYGLVMCMAKLMLLAWED